MKNKMSKWFGDVATKTAQWAGSPYAFIGSVLMVVVWLFTGPPFKFSDTWQLIINTPTTVITFWMVFVIQNTQNRDMLALQIKLDELINVIEGADSKLTDVEDLTQEELEEIREQKKKEG